MFRIARRVSSAVLLLFAAALASAQAYTSVVVFGDSLSDTGNIAHLTQSSFAVRYPGPLFNYTDGRFTDGVDTTPAARMYTGVWVEQVAATLASKPLVKASLDGGTDYAFGGATTVDGTSVATVVSGPTGNLNITLENMGQQVTDYLATGPVITNKTLFVVWGGANDILRAKSAADLTAAAARDAALVQRLIAAGATDIIVPNLPPLGAIPQNNGSPTAAAAATQAAQVFNQALAAGIVSLTPQTGKPLHVLPLDVYTLFTTLIGPPLGGGLVNVTVSAQGQSSSLNPDTYLFWDGLHPTTAGHHLLAVAAQALIVPAGVTASFSPSSLTVASGSAGMSTLTVTPAGGFSGTVMLACGALPAHVSCTFSPASLTFGGANAAQTSTLTVGTNAAAALRLPGLLGQNAGAGIYAAFAAFPCLGMLGLAGVRKRRMVFGRVLLLGMLFAGVTLTLAGCGGSSTASTKAAPGTYTIPVTVTAAGSTSTVSLSVTVQ